MKVILLVSSVLIGSHLIAADTGGIAKLQSQFRPLPGPITCKIFIEEVSGKDAKEVAVCNAVIDWPRFFLSYKNGMGQREIYGTDGTTEWLVTGRCIALATREGLDNFGRRKQTKLGNFEVEPFIDLIGLQYLAQVLQSADPAQVRQDAAHVSFNYNSTNLDLTRTPGQFTADIDKNGDFSSLSLSGESTTSRDITNMFNLSFLKIVYSDLKDDPLARGRAADRIEIYIGGGKCLRCTITFQKALDAPSLLFQTPVNEVNNPFTGETLPITVGYDAREDGIKGFIIGTNLTLSALSFKETCLRSPLSPDTIPSLSRTNLNSQSK